MRSAIALAAAGMLSVASAGHHDHALFHKRHYNETEQCSTVWSTWYGEPTLIPLPPATSSTSTSTTETPTPTPSSSSSSIVVSTTPEATPEATPTPTPAAKKVQALAAVQLGGSRSGQNFFGFATGKSGMNAITYSPYAGGSKASSSCKSADEISSDIQAINARGFNTIRLYATDCGQLTAAGPAVKAAGMQMILGIFTNSRQSAQSDFSEQLAEIQSYIRDNGADHVAAILISNEPFLPVDNPDAWKATPSQIASFLAQTKAAFPSIKVSCPMTHPELIANSQLCGAMDMVAAQIHPFFASSFLNVVGAGDYVESEMELMSQICGGKPVFVSETGYPSSGGTFLSQLAGAAEQSVAIASIKNSAKAHHITMFSSSDDGWKLAPGVAPYEAAFNCLNLF